MNWTIHAASSEWGIDRRTLKKRMSEQGHDVTVEGREYTTRDISKAVHATGDLKAEKTRETKFRADLLELEHKEKLGELVSLSEVQRIMSETFQPIRDLINQLPSQVGSRCNPTDPQCAMEALEDWKKIALPLIRSYWPTRGDDATAG